MVWPIKIKTIKKIPQNICLTDSKNNDILLEKSKIFSTFVSKAGCSFLSVEETTAFFYNVQVPVKPVSVTYSVCQILSIVRQ